MRILFCSDPMNSRAPDSMYETEAEAAHEAGLNYNLVNFERLVYEQRATAAIATIPMAENEELCLFRGWMMTPPHYEMLYKALLDKGLRLVNSPVAYRHCHYFPENYSIIAPYTPKSVWLPYHGTIEIEDIMEAVGEMGNVPLILKDYVKSRKHEWYDACFIPSAANRADVERVVKRFVELQGDDLNEGLVFREFVPFRPLTAHSKSGMPLTVEYRCFVMDGEIKVAIPYWEEGTYTAEPPPLEHFALVAQAVQSRFFTMDIAQREDGSWLIVELGDGQVAGLPETAKPDAFYRQIATAFQSA